MSKSWFFIDSVSVLDVVKAEINKGDDELTEWISAMSELKIMDRRDRSIMAKYGAVLSYLQNSPLYNDKALRAWSDVNVADPWLVATAAAKGYTIITFEQSVGKISEKNPSGNLKFQILRELLLQEKTSFAIISVGSPTALKSKGGIRMDKNSLAHSVS